MRIIYVFNAFVVLLYLIPTTEAQSGTNLTTRELWTTYLLLRTDNPFKDFDVELVYDEMPHMMEIAYNGNRPIIQHLIKQFTYLTRYRLQARAYRELIREMVKWNQNNNEEAIMLAYYLKEFQRKVDQRIGWDSDNEKELQMTKTDLKSAIDRLPDIVRVLFFAKEFLIVPKVKNDGVLQVDDSIGCMHEIEFGYEKWSVEVKSVKVKGSHDDFSFRFRNSRSGKILNVGQDEEEPDADNQPNDYQYWKLIGQDNTQWFLIQHKKESMYLAINENIIPCQVYCFTQLVDDEIDYYLWKFQESK